MLVWIFSPFVLLAIGVSRAPIMLLLVLVALTSNRSAR